MLSLLKPWFVWNPRQLALRVARGMVPPAEGARPLRTAWGVDLIADPRKPLGKSLLNTGIYDIAVSEVLARLIKPGDTVVDAGANLGYMTVLAATVAGPSGRVISFEPHPALSEVLLRNVANARTHYQLAKVDLHTAALGEIEGYADLIIPPEMDSNEGLAYIAPAGATEGDQAIRVRLETLDSVLGEAHIEVMKLEVEGHELAVLRGASKALEGRRIKHIVFEDHEGDGSDTARHLLDLGYTLFSVGWAVRGLQVIPASGRKASRDYEAPSYLATLEPSEAIKRCSKIGWRVLRSPLVGSRE
jgi:FkbM family methyltransferase